RTGFDPDLTRPDSAQNFGHAGCQAGLVLQKCFAGQLDAARFYSWASPAQAAHIYSSTPM
ncbi:hypothetical protein PanWU01x14_168370, partial [Parasponia andersonii]